MNNFELFIDSGCVNLGIQFKSSKYRSGVGAVRLLSPVIYTGRVRKGVGKIDVFSESDIS